MQIFHCTRSFLAWLDFNILCLISLSKYQRVYWTCHVLVRAKNVCKSIELILLISDGWHCTYPQPLHNVVWRHNILVPLSTLINANESLFGDEFYIYDFWYPCHCVARICRNELLWIFNGKSAECHFDKNATITCFRCHSTIIPHAHIRAHMIIKKIREHMKKKDFATFANMR